LPHEREHLAIDPGQLSDDELVRGIRAGSESHFDELYRRYFQRIYNFTYHRVRNRADTEELVQEAFAAVFRSIGAYRGTSPLLAWIYGIAKNTVNNFLRRTRNQEGGLERARPRLERVPDTLGGGTPEEQLALRRYAAAMHSTLERLGGWQAEVFVLRHVENLPIREIARRTSRSNDAIRSSLCRVKRLLVAAGELSPVRS
jgi:RNA polymerase sigma-70 factor (ECF subfamily)